MRTQHGPTHAISAPRAPTRDMAGLVRAFGDGDLIASATLQAGLRRFETSFGAWAYARVAGMDVTLGGPLCAPSDRGAMARRFLAQARRPVLMYLRRSMLDAIDPDAPLHAACIGVDRHADGAALLADPPKPVRGALKRARKAGVRWREVDLARLTPALRRRLEAITAAYLARSEITVEMRFLNRPMDYRPDPFRRVFTLQHGDEVFGYAVLNAIYNEGRLEGWLLDLLRFPHTPIWGLWLSTVHTLTAQLAAEGHTLALGFCPMHRAGPAPHLASRTVDAQIDWMVRYLSTTQYLARLRELKAIIPGHEEPRYMASFTRLVPVTLYAFVEAMGVGFGYLFGPDLWKVLREGWQANASRAQETP